ncbi:MAG TPA: hypothetical protein VF463_01245 [Sphingobium sp.]
MAYAAPRIEQPEGAGESPVPAQVLHTPLPAPDGGLPDEGLDSVLEPGLGDAIGIDGTSDTASVPDRTESYDHVVRAVGSLVCSWGSLERTTMDKLSAMRLAAGDVRLVGGRMRPGMARLLAELRALVSMRDRHDKQGLVVIADLENHIQRIAQFHLLIISGFQASEADVLLCRDSKNSERRISLADVEREIAMIETIKERLSAI